MESIIRKKSIKRKEIREIDERLLSIKNTAKRFRQSPFWTIEDYEDCCTLIRADLNIIETELHKLKNETLLINSIK